MIKNNRQLNASRRQLMLFDESIKSLRASFDAADKEAKARLAIALRSAESMHSSIAAEIEEYERLLKGDLSVISINGLNDLPRALIKARIAHGWSQRQLAEKLGVKPQQVQRWEHEEYERTGFDRIEEVAEMLGISRQIRIQPKLSGGAFIATPSLAPKHNPTFGYFSQIDANLTIIRGTSEIRFSGNDNGSKTKVDVIENRHGISMRLTGLSTEADGIYTKQVKSAIAVRPIISNLTENRKHG